MVFGAILGRWASDFCGVSFTLGEKKRERKSMSKHVTPFGPVGYITYARTYAREKEDGTKEEFHESIERVITASRDQLNVGFTKAEEDKLREYLLKLKG